MTKVPIDAAILNLIFNLHSSRCCFSWALFIPAKSENSFRYLTLSANIFQILILIFMFVAYDGSKTF